MHIYPHKIYIYPHKMHIYPHKMHIYPHKIMNLEQFIKRSENRE